MFRSAGGGWQLLGAAQLIAQRALCSLIVDGYIEVRDARKNAANEERLTEDEIARRKLGPRGVPGAEDSAKMTPQQNLPRKANSTGTLPSLVVVGDGRDVS